MRSAHVCWAFKVCSFKGQIVSVQIRTFERLKERELEQKEKVRNRDKLKGNSNATSPLPSTVPSHLAQVPTSNCDRLQIGTLN